MLQDVTNIQTYKKRRKKKNLRREVKKKSIRREVKKKSIRREEKRKAKYEKKREMEVSFLEMKYTFFK